MRNEHVGGQHPAQVAAEIAFGIEVEELAVAAVRVHELAHLVVVDRHDERRLRQRVEHGTDVGGERQPIVPGPESPRP